MITERHGDMPRAEPVRVRTINGATKTHARQRENAHRGTPCAQKRMASRSKMQMRKNGSVNKKRNAFYVQQCGVTRLARVLQRTADRQRLRPARRVRTRGASA